jgi:hypothetical protein
MSVPIGIEDLEQASQIRDLFRKAIRGPEAPLALRAAMTAVVRDNFADLSASHGADRAAATIAEVAFLAGRQAERIGLPAGGAAP